MGNAFDRAINKGPPFSPRCEPECEPSPNDLRGNTCYKGKCVSLCPVNSTATEDGKCLCIEDNSKFVDSNKKMKNKPLEGDGWGYCSTGELENKFKPEYLFIDRVPKELDERVKIIVRRELRKNPTMSQKELDKLISKTTIDVVEELAITCKDEYKVVKMILSPSYGNGKWPTKSDLKVLIANKNFPWLKSQIDQWPEEKEITSCKILSAVKDKIAINNVCIYSDEYPDIKEECNVDCGLGIEVRQKKIIKKPNIDFPSLQTCQSIPPIKEFECDSGVVCKEDCKLQTNTKSFGQAKCSKPCDSGDGPGKKTYKIKYVKASQGEPGNKGSCELDEQGKVEGQEYDITVDCNTEKCPDCEISSKGPYKDNLIDYTGSINDANGETKTFTKCLLPKKDGTYKAIDCGGSESGHNYYKGARVKYNVSYKITEDAFGVQNCTKGEDVVEEGCPVNAIDTELNPIVGTDGNLLKGGGEECENNCILSDDYPEEVTPCNKTCGGGIKIMRKTVKSKFDAKYCPCRDDTSKCPTKEVPCNTQDCIADCVYTNGKDTEHKQINATCPGIDGPNKHIVWDTQKINSKGDRGMWYDSKTGKFYERKHFVKKMRVPTIEPIIGKGKCHQGNKADYTQDCKIEGTEKKIDAEWGPWELKKPEYVGIGYTLREIDEEESTWDHKNNPNFGKKGEHCVIEEGLEETDTVLPGIRYYRKLKNLPDGEPGPRYGGKRGSEVGSGKNWKIEPYMKKSDGSGYTKYCPEDAFLIPGGNWEKHPGYKSEWGNEDLCYQPNNIQSRDMYTEKELEAEFKRKFERDNRLPNYKDPSRYDTNERRIVGPGNRTIYRTLDRSKTEEYPDKYGGFFAGEWHKTSKGYTEDQDKRLTEYDECEGVGKIFSIMKKDINDISWKSHPFVKQKPCKPVYNWDGKFYTDKASAKAGSTKEETISHSNSTGKKNLSSSEKKDYPGVNTKKTDDGKFLTNYMHEHCKKPALDSDTGWCGNASTDNFIQMITGSEQIELIKGVVTQGRSGTSYQWVKTFEVYVSRNGDSWKQVKNSSGSTTFTGNTDTTTKVTNYFYEKNKNGQWVKTSIEGRYIRFVPKTWNNYNSMRIGYIRDKSGVINCIGESGMTDNPFFRFTFDETKTKDPKFKGQYSEGTSPTTKVCPEDGKVMIAERTPEGLDINSIFPEENLKIVKDNGSDNLKQYMSEQTIKGCGVDPTHSGWYSAESGGTPKIWSECVKPKNNGLADKGNKAYNVDDKGYMYMYRRWDATKSSNDKIYGQGNGYKMITGNSYKNNTYDGSLSSNNSTYDQQVNTNTNFNVNDYDSVNIIRQPCNRGAKMVLPTLSTEWVSTIPAATGGTSGWKGNIWNYSGGTEGWLDQEGKFKWDDGFKLRVYDLIKNKGVGTRKDVNEYLVEEKEGTNNNDDNNSWDANWRNSGSEIDGDRAYHVSTSSLWNTSLSSDKSVAKYKQSSYFMPVGIKIQPRKHSGVWKKEIPTEVKLVWNGGSKEVTLGTFATQNTIKTILIDPGLRKKTKYLDVYTRHGRGSGWGSFRINYLIGKIGGGYSQDKGHNVNNTNNRPVECQDGKKGLSGSELVNVGNQTVDNPGWTWSDCSKSCDGGSKNGSRTVTYTQKQKYTKVDPSHGGKNNCSDTNAPDVTSSKKETTTADCNTHECKERCHGNWSAWQNDNSVCCCEKTRNRDIFTGKCQYRCDGQWRYYTVTKKARGGGQACPASNDQGDTRRSSWRYFEKSC